MIAVVYVSPQDGPAQVWLLPVADGELPASAAIPGDIGPGALVFPKYKGSAISWRDWADELSESPWLGDYTIQLVPDGITPEAALSYVRDRYLERAAGF